MLVGKDPKYFHPMTFAADNILYFIRKNQPDKIWEISKYDAKSDALIFDLYKTFKFYEVTDNWLWMFQDTTIPEPENTNIIEPYIRSR